MTSQREIAGRLEREEPSPREGPFSLSLVVPMYNESKMCRLFLERVVPIVEGVTEDYEIVCVDDGSRDQTLALLATAHANNPRVKVVSLTRNFGKEAALTAGIDHARGDAIIPIDADLQDPPELIPKLVQKWREGSDTVIALRADRRSDSYLKRTTARWFYRLIGRLSDVPMLANAGDFRLLDRAVVEALGRLPERRRFMKGLYAWVGFNPTIVEYARPPRAAGVTKWRAWGLWNLALEGLFSFTTLPLRIWTYAGFATALFAGAYGLFIILRTLIRGVDVPGYASLLVVLLFFSGMNMIGLGILGEYVGRIFAEVKQRPLYLVDTLIGVDDDASQPARASRRSSPARARETSPERS